MAKDQHTPHLRPPTPFPSHTRVRMTDACRRRLISTGAADHAADFGDCVGTVEPVVLVGRLADGDVEVRWQPSGLKYVYARDELEPVE
jgi:hypothetical protein